MYCVDRLEGLLTDDRYRNQSAVRHCQKDVQEVGEDCQEGA